MKQRLYIDTSVFGGYFDEEFSEFTRPLFKRLQNGEFKLLFSSITQDEISTAPEKVKELVKSLKFENTEFIETNNEAVELATQYIA
jgi:predicted nucleic acid-binding protein